MKKILYKKIVLIVSVLLSICLLNGCTSIDSKIIFNNENDELILKYDEVKDSIIRFHVIANSDSEEDQNLKLKVKNKVIEYLYDKLNKSQSLEESRQIINDNMEQVKEIASEIIKNSQYNYNVDVELGRENFPDKAYGNIILPQGNYEAFRVIIGDGQGKNWWCVMFPPLCFINPTTGIVSDESKETLQENLSEEEYRIISDTNNTSISFKFKIIEFFKNNGLITAKNN